MRRSFLLSALALLIVAAPGVAAGAGLTLSASAGPVEPGGTAAVPVTVVNDGPEPVAVVVDIAGVPDGWEVTNRSNDGAVWNGAERKWLFRTVEPNESVAPSATVVAPGNATGDHSVEVRATTSRDATVTEAVGLRVVTPEPTATPTPTPRPTDAAGPGFGGHAAAVCLLAAALASARRGGPGL